MGFWYNFCTVTRVKMSVIKKKERKRKRKKSTRKERKRKKNTRKHTENTVIKGPFSHNCITFLCTLHMHKRSP